MWSPPRSQASGPAELAHSANSPCTLRPHVSIVNRGENVSWKLTDKSKIEIQIVKKSLQTPESCQKHRGEAAGLDSPAGYPRSLTRTNVGVTFHPLCQYALPFRFIILSQKSFGGSKGTFSKVPLAESRGRASGASPAFAPPRQTQI